MRAWMRFALALAFVVSRSELHGQISSIPDGPPPAPAAPVKPEPMARGRITGSVICGDTRQPARGATVLLTPLAKGKDGPNSGGRAMTSRVGQNGMFDFEHVAPGEYGVLAFSQGYLSVMDELPPDAMIGGNGDSFEKSLPSRYRVTVGADGTASTEVVLERGAALSGRVVYADGAPATQVTVAPEDTGVERKKSKDTPDYDQVLTIKSLLTHQSYSADDLGHFRMSGLKPGTYRIAVVSPVDLSGGGLDDLGMGILFSGMIDAKSVRFYSGDTYHRKAAKVYEVRAGDEVTGIEIRLPIDGFHSVRGNLTAIDGRPINMGELTLTDTTDEELVYYAKPDLDGSFQFRSVEPGSYTLKAKSAFIGGLPAGMPPDSIGVQLQPTNAFSDGTAAVIVKDADLSGVALSLTETAMPKTPPGQVPQNVDDN